MIDITAAARIFEFPADKDAGLVCFLGLLHNPWETWISAYGFTLQPLFNEIKAADAAGVHVHLLLDHTQACGHAESPMVHDLAASLVHGDLTICTSPVAGQIWHDKALVATDPAGLASSVWWGSVNFSASGFDQGNIAELCASEDLARALVARFTTQRYWARAHEPQYQFAA